MKKYTWIFALFCVIALLFAGCGDSGGSSGPGGPSTPKTYTQLASLSDFATELPGGKLTLVAGAWSTAFANGFDVSSKVTLANKQTYKLDVEFTISREDGGDATLEGNKQLEVHFLDDSEAAGYWSVLSNYYTNTKLTVPGPNSLEIILKITTLPDEDTKISFAVPANGSGNAGAGEFEATTGDNPFILTFTKFDISLQD